MRHPTPYEQSPATGGSFTFWASPAVLIRLHNWYSQELPEPNVIAKKRAPGPRNRWGELR